MHEEDSIPQSEKSGGSDKTMARDKPTSGPGSATSGTQGHPETMAGSRDTSSPLRSSTQQDEHDGDGPSRASEAKHMAGQIFGDVRNAAEQMLEERKARAADQVHGVAQALRRTAEGVKGENDLVGRYAEQAAATVERFADTVRERRIGDLVAKLDDFARRSPTLFFSGAVAAGFVVGRFMAASGERPEAASRAAHEYRDEPRRSRAPQRTQTAGYGAGGNYSGTRGNA